MVAEPFATPTNAQPSPGLAAGEGHFYSDGFRPGDFKFCYGVLADLLARNPGWHLADGAVALQDGSIPPDLRDRFIIGAGLTYALGAAGGAAGAPAHSHAFTQPDAHVITQPVFAAHANLAHDNNHSGSAVTQHGFASAEIAGATFVAGTNNWIIYQNSLANVIAALSHSVTQATAHGAHAPTNNHSRTTDTALSNNHSGGAVGAVSGGGSSLPPYAALYILVKVS